MWKWTDNDSVASNWVLQSGETTLFVVMCLYTVHSVTVVYKLSYVQTISLSSLQYSLSWEKDWGRLWRQRDRGVRIWLILKKVERWKRQAFHWYSKYGSKNGKTNIYLWHQNICYVCKYQQQHRAKNYLQSRVLSDTEHISQNIRDRWETSI